MTIEVLKSGLLTTLQDTGRPGFAHLGVGRAGAFDAPALRIANALCGNPSDACALEITLLGPTLRFRGDAWIAVTGAPIPFRMDGADQQTWASVFVAAGATVELGAMRSGCRSYLAVRGGIEVAPVLGSRGTDVNARLGPLAGRPLRTGDTLAMGAATSPARATASMPMSWRLDPRPWFPEETPVTLRLLPGNHFDKLKEISHKLLFSEIFTVQADSNRAGLRLSGPALEFREPIEMVSEGCVPGTLQLPPSGQAIAFGPECPVSGGYPRIGQIAAVDIPRLAQRRPGDALRFTPCTFDDALRALRERERALTRLETGIATRLIA
ncbi:MAG: biotin-dependent carboxyltransferase family protein [Pseudomonadota bacterium]|nr:biotin-dependent carboxyltransferase family protein [Xanthomonadaceae bacterium]MDE3073718.1 biotin-dependent carboxyltransferase family protein [Pseudomonadota bacterium]